MRKSYKVFQSFSDKQYRKKKNFDYYIKEGGKIYAYRTLYAGAADVQRTEIK